MDSYYTDKQAMFAFYRDIIWHAIVKTLVLIDDSLWRHAMHALRTMQWQCKWYRRRESYVT
jgi:hypothetical protein